MRGRILSVLTILSVAMGSVALQAKLVNPVTPEEEAQAVKEEKRKAIENRIQEIFLSRSL